MIVEDEIKSRRTELSPEKKALLEKRLRGVRKDAMRVTIPRLSARHRSPLSFAQQRLWFLNQLEPNSPLYNIPTALRLSGRLDREALGKALNAVVERHEALRTRFEAEDGNPVQVIEPAGAVEMAMIDIAPYPDPQREEELQRLLDEEARRPFDLVRGPLLRAALLRLSESEHVLMINMHHIISDAWSMGVFFRELGAFYTAFSAGREISLPELPVQYIDFAVWQRRQMNTEAMDKQLAYWKRHLDGAPHFLELPADKTRPAAQSFNGSAAKIQLSKPLTESLRRLSQTEGATLFMTLLTAFKILLHRHTRQSNLVVGSPFAGRTQFETEGLIGFFVNTLALHTRISGNPSFRDMLRTLRQSALDSHLHQDLPFERLVEELQPARSPGRIPLVQILFTLQNNAAAGVQWPELTVKPIKVNTGTAKFDLMLAVEELPEGMEVEVEYSTDLFNEGTIASLLEHFQTLLEGIAADPTRRISELPLLKEEGLQRVLKTWNNTRTDYPRQKTVAQLFEEQAEKNPGVPAVIFNGRQLTYAELNQQANKLARHLQKLGVNAGVMVGVSLERSPELIIALLGILKAGGAYVSLDPATPRERLALMLDDVQAPVVLTREIWRSQFKFESHAPILVCLDAGWDSSMQQQPANPGSRATAESPAYVSFTSGSTGRPKGVVVPNRGVTRLVKNTDYARLGPDEVFLQFAPVAFDASTLEIWGPLLNGGRLVVFPPQTPSLTELGEFIRQNKITTLWLTAGLFHQMVEEQLENLRGLRQLLAGGDVLSVPHVKRALENLPDCDLINGYGPTENTTFTCCHRITAADCRGDSIPIGRPIANTQVYILDEYLQPAPAGVPGELCAAGDGLALGYLEQPQMTAEKFIPNPFSDEPGAKLYKTGDLARWLPDGRIEYLGRIDQQLKIRGFRVEPGEIEAALSRHPAVRECAVTAWGSMAGAKQLAAYFVANTTPPPGAEELRAHLRRVLPEYMIPAAFVPMDQLPLNSNGKVNRAALPAPDRADTAGQRTFVAPRDEFETRLSKIWEEVLGINPIGMEDHFFDLGGHSLMAVRVVALIEKGFGRKLSVATVFQLPTIAQLADALRDKKELTPTSSLVAIQPKGSKPPLFFVHGVGGGMFWGYTNLSKYIGADQPIFAFKSRGMDGLDEFGTIEEMAAQYVRDLRAFQPRGPYHIGGYCFGGNIAYEMARQIRAQGEKVSLLALINCAPPNGCYSHFRFTPAACFKFVKNLGYWIDYLYRIKAEQRNAMLSWKVKSALRRVKHFFKGSKIEVEEFVDLSAQPQDRHKLWGEHVRTLLTHKTQPFAGDLTLFRTPGHPLVCSFDNDFGWHEFVGGNIEIKMIPGTHEGALDEPHVQTLAKIMRQHLQEMQNTETSKGQL